MGQGASLAEETVLADSGRAGENTCRGWAGEKSGLFEHLAKCAPVVPDVQTYETPVCPPSFSAAW